MLLHSLLSSRIAAAAVVVLAPLRIAAQDRAVPPTEVTIVADGAAAVVTWTPVPAEGVMYRVVRTLDLRSRPIDITTEPVGEAKVYDSRIQAGVTYFYQVIAVYPDASTASAAFVSFTAPAAVAATTTTTTAPVTAVAPATVTVANAVTGVTVVGNTTASALVSWQPVAGATSYSIKRSYSTSSGTQSNTAVSGLTTASWNDLGPQGAGFPTAGSYTYDVTAVTPFGNVSGQAGWKRPDPSCAPPAETQQALTVLDPMKLAVVGPVFPAGVTLLWQVGWGRNGAIALRLDRSEQVKGTWTPVGSSCDGILPTDAKNSAFADNIKGYAPNTTYLYRLTAIAPNGEVGIATFPWTSPNASVIRWLSATSSGNTVTLNFRYEAPATNPPASPDTRFTVSAPYGLSKLVDDGNGCRKVAGCTLVVTGVPSGTQEFTVTAVWNFGGGALAKLFGRTTVVVP